MIHNLPVIRGMDRVAAACEAGKAQVSYGLLQVLYFSCPYR